LLFQPGFCEEAASNVDERWSAKPVQQQDRQLPALELRE